MSKARNCITHHYACDCREEKFFLVEKENAKLKKQNEILKSYLTDYYDEALEEIKQLERDK